MASVLPLAMVPLAMLTIPRSLPTEPIETVFATLATDPTPIATALVAVTRALKPRAVADAALAVAPLPMAVALVCPAPVAPACAPAPIAITPVLPAPPPPALALCPSAMASVVDAVAVSPKAVLLTPSAPAETPKADAPAAVALVTLAPPLTFVPPTAVDPSAAALAFRPIAVLADVPAKKPRNGPPERLPATAPAPNATPPLAEVVANEPRADENNPEAAAAPPLELLIAKAPAPVAVALSVVAAPSNTTPSFDWARAGAVAADIPSAAPAPIASSMIRIIRDSFICSLRAVLGARRSVASNRIV